VIEVPWAGLPDYQCFGCSPRNDSGLRLRFEADGEDLVTTFTAERRHESYPGVLHGGLIGVVCDEAMGNLIVLNLGLAAFTVTQRTVFVTPLRIGETYTCVARLRKPVDGDVVRAESEIQDADGVLVASSTASYRTTDLSSALRHMRIGGADADALQLALSQRSSTEY
jgi:acyl-coenzyme A thioesterase PaaI-like protein